MVKEGEPALPPPSAAESDHNHSVEEETAVTEPLQKSKEILQKSKEILKKFKESYRTSQESKELLGVVDISMDICHFALQSRINTIWQTVILYPQCSSLFSETI